MFEYIFVHSIDKRPVGSNVGLSIPLHMTLVPWFKTPMAPQYLISKVKPAIESLASVTTTTTHEDLFGPNIDIPVMRLQKTQTLVDLHQALLDIVINTGGQLDTKWTGPDKWQPHVTHKPDRRMLAGEKLSVDAIDLLNRAGRNSGRLLLHRFSLQPKASSLL